MILARELRRRHGPPPAAALPSGEPPVAAEILERGWGYAPSATRTSSRIGPTPGPKASSARTRAEGLPPAPDDWGDDRRVGMGRQPRDRLPRDRSVRRRETDRGDGHSRIGKTALWASANDLRIAAVFSSCAGEMGSALSRRDWGETVDDMAQNFPWWFAASSRNGPAGGTTMPVDAHMLIALARRARSSSPAGPTISGPTRSASSWRWSPPDRSTAARQERPGRHRRCRRSTRRSTTATSAGTTTRGAHGPPRRTGRRSSTFLDKYFK